jgi:L-ascorbate metabolism protein UlaG (beta-lactamase superfamily)
LARDATPVATVRRAARDVRSPAVPSFDPPDRLTWIGHATVLAELDGVRLMTDPVLTARIAHLRRHGPIDDDTVAAGVDAVLISHVHVDHLHVRSLRRLARDTTVVAPAGAGRLLRARGFDDVHETRAGDSLRVGDVDVVTVPARHGHRRGPHSRVAASAVGYVMRWRGGAVYFAGDTDLFDEMVDLAPVDVALLPIWGWGPTLGTGHLDPERAAEATRRLDAGLVVPIHWGTYSPAAVRRRPPRWLSTPVGRFRDELDRIGLLERARVLAPGERLELARSAEPRP